MTTGKKNAVSRAAETLVGSNEPVAVTTIPVYTGSDLFAAGKFGLAADPAIRAAAAGAVVAEDTAAGSWSILADMIRSKGITSIMLGADEKKGGNPDARRETLDILAVTKYGNQVAAVGADGSKVSMVHDIRASWGSLKAAAWVTLPAERKRAARACAGQITGTYMNRLKNALVELEDPSKKGKKEVLTLEERYLNLLGPVLLFLQNIDQTKVDPKFDWQEEFAAVSLAVSRAKKAKTLATTAPKK